MLRLVAVFLSLGSALSASAAEPPTAGVSKTEAAHASGLGGLFIYGGVAAWPQKTGLALSFGLFHQYRVGFEVGVNIPLSERESTPGPFVFSTIQGRVVLLREGLTSPRDGAPPSVGLIVGLRAGIGLLDKVGTSGSPVALSLGPSIEFHFGRTLLIGLRPSVGVRSVANTSDSAGSGVQVLPSIDLSLGWVSEAAYTP